MTQEAKEQEKQGTHTPGPWVVFGDPEDECPGIEADEVSVIVYGIRLHNDTGVQGKTVEEAKANARLIAAAPDLLAELEAIIKSADECEVSTWPGVPLVSVDARLIDSARATIHKATGKD